MQKKTIWKFKRTKIWVIVSSILLAIFLTASIVVTCTPFLYNTISSVLGGEQRVLKKGDPSKYMRYTADYDSKEDVLDAANALNEQICEEGIILLKNENDALPLKNTEKKITIFGKNSVNLVLGGSGSNAGSAQASDMIDLYTSLRNAGFEYNPVIHDFYKRKESGSGRVATPGIGSILTGYPIAETPISSYTSAVRNSYAQYPDAALVVISRICGEGYDLPRTMFWNGSNYTSWADENRQIIPGARSMDDHYLQLDKNETDMIKEACQNFDKVIVIINSASPMELGFLDDPNHYAYNQNLKAALWIGNPGNSGINALGKVLNGSVNPSGKTVDTYARDFKNDPTWNNFGNNRVNNGNRYMTDGKEKNAYFVEYEEGIYVGYRYYETRGFTDGEAWYRNNVVFPFGYGKSYTTFEWEVQDITPEVDSVISADSVISVSVKVRNTGNFAGKEVVQLYYTPPYIEGEIEKAHVVLGDFVKTDLLEPGQEQTVTLTLNARNMASYDYNDANNNGFCGYELDVGDYEIKIMRDSHTLVESFTYRVDEQIQYTTDAVTGAQIQNLFDDVSNHINEYLSRSNNWQNWSILAQTPSTQDRTVTQDFINSLNFKTNDDADDPWFSNHTPNQSAYSLSAKEAKIKLYDLIGKDYDDPLWDQLMDQLTVDEMVDLISMGNFRTLNIDSIAKPLTIDADGPMGFAIFMGDPSIYDTCYYASACVLGATWNIDLAEEMGKMIGNEGLIGNERGDGRPYSGWYAPAVNMHRSQFGGRNFEYYSEDGLHSGKLAQAIIKGAKSKGVYTYLKHFALNEQETNRDTTGLITWANEQAMRELYFVPFEICVKEGQTTAMMSAFNRIGSIWSGGSYNLLTKLLREEWGFRGMVITDFNLKPYMNLDQMIRAGGDLNLSPGKKITSTSSPTAVTAIRKAAKNILCTVANSNAMNGIGEGVVWGYSLPKWVYWLILVDIGLVVICGGWGAWAIISSNKKVKDRI
jgi:beta-glucosidase